MARPSTHEPINRGDLVEYDDHTWTVVGRTEEAGLPGHPSVVHLSLERSAQKPVKTPYGKPQRYKTIPVPERVLEGRVALVARQQRLFD